MNRMNVNATPFIMPILRTILFLVLGLLPLAFNNRWSLHDISKWWMLIAITVNILTIIYLIYVAKKNNSTYKDYINHTSKSKIKSTILTVIIMLILGMSGLWIFSFLVYGYLPVTTIQPLPVWVAFICFILLPITTLLAELPFYLGYCSKLIKDRTENEKLSIIYPLFFYAAQHSFIPLLFDYKHLLSRFLMFVPLLVYIGYKYKKDNDLQNLMIGHGVLDLMTAIQLLIVSLYPSIYITMMNINP